MKSAIIVGYGSIGKRHASIQKEMGLDVTVVTKQKLPQESDIIAFDCLENALKHKSPDFILIANETSSHLTTLKKLEHLNFTGKILCEKPISLNAFKMEELPKIGPQILVTYNLRFHPLIQKLKSLLHGQKVISFMAYVGQYLPDWSPGTNYSKGYSAKKEQGGGVLRDLSHEIDFANYLFGKPKQIKGFTGKVSDLNISSEDIANINWITQTNGIGMISLNYLDRKANRFLIINTNECTYKADFINSELWINNEVQKIETHRNTTYQNMYTAFLDNQTNEFCTIQQALEVMEIIEQAELN